METYIGPGDVELFDVFINSAGTTTMCFNRKPGAIHLLSYSGSIYWTSMAGTQKYIRSSITPEKFIGEYPESNLGDEAKSIFEKIKNRILTQKQSKNETIGIIEADRSTEGKRGIGVPTGKRQVTTGLRPVGNAVGFKIKTTRTVETEIRSSVVAC